MKKTNKKIWVILSAIIVVGVAGGAAFALYSINKNHKKPAVAKIDLANDQTIQTELQLIVDRNEKDKWIVTDLQAEIDNDVNIGSGQITVIESDKLMSFTNEQSDFIFTGNNLKYSGTKDLVQTYNVVDATIDIGMIQVRLQTILDNQRQAITNANDMQKILDDNKIGKEQGIEVGLEETSDKPVITTLEHDKDHKEGTKIEFIINGKGNLNNEFLYGNSTTIIQENLISQATGYKNGNQIEYTWNHNLQSAKINTIEVVQIGFNESKIASQLSENLLEITSKFPKEITSTTRMFYQSSLFNGDISSWNTSNVKIMSSMFSNAKSFNGDISSWNTSNLTDASYMFNYANAFNQDISSWNTSKVKTMTSMFNYAKSFNQDLSGWKVEKVSTHSNFATGAQAWTKSKPTFKA